MRGLAGKSIIVTGGGSGIGAAAAEVLGEEGCRVTVADTNEEGGRSVADAICKAGQGHAQFVRTDVSDEAQVQAMIAAAEAAYGGVDGAINSAGVGQRGVPMDELTSAEWQRVHNINLFGMFLCFKYQVKALKRRGGGSLVAISAGSAIMGVPNSSEYSAAKSGVNGLVRATSVDYAAQNIRVNAILPGGTKTPMMMSAMAQDPNIGRIIETFPMKRAAEPREIAETAVWLLSDGASYVTGATWTVDGALSL